MLKECNLYMHRRFYRAYCCIKHNRFFRATRVYNSKNDAYSLIFFFKKNGVFVNRYNFSVKWHFRNASSLLPKALSSNKNFMPNWKHERKVFLLSLLLFTENFSQFFLETRKSFFKSWSTTSNRKITTVKYQLLFTSS